MSKKRPSRLRAAAALVTVAALLIFILSNTQSIVVRVFTWKLEAPISLVVLFSALAGVALWPLLRSVFRRRRD